MQLIIRQHATDHTVDDTRPHHTQRPDGRPYSQQVYGMGEDNTTSSSGGSDKGGPRPGVYRVFVTQRSGKSARTIKSYLTHEILPTGSQENH